MGPESSLLHIMRGGREGTYRFDCPTCMEPVEKRADRKIVALLVSAGVDAPARPPGGTEEMFEPELDLPEDPRGPLPQGPAFSIDDVIEPKETRPRLINALEMLSNKRDGNPAKKHGNIPL